VGRAALDELLKGPSVEEKEKGYLTAINEGVKVEKLTIENGVAKADFNSRLEEAVGGSCRVNLIRSQIVNTLMQFSTVKEVVISIEGKTEDILEP
jgi:spore germination protein GerM